MRGGPDFAQSQVNLTLRGRQTGSAFKFVILTAALATGAQPNDVINGQAPCVLPNAGDPAAVVDPHCRVIGYERLRGCDASVMPDLPRANTHLTTVAIAEGLAALLNGR